jgi:hypothetical protein
LNITCEEKNYKNDLDDALNNNKRDGLMV